MQSVKPPVEAPTSMLTLPSRETPNYSWLSQVSGRRGLHMEVCFRALRSLLFPGTCSCFVFFLSVYIYISGHDICFCFFSGRCKCTLNHQKIQSFFHCCSSYSSIASRMSGADRPIFARRLPTSPCSTKRFQIAIGRTRTSG